MTSKQIHEQRMMKEAEQAIARLHTRRHFLKESAFGFGSLALGSLLPSCKVGSDNSAFTIPFDPAHPLAPKLPMFPGKTKSVIHLQMAGSPSQLDPFAFKPHFI